MDYAGLQVHIWLLPAIAAFFILMIGVPLLISAIANVGGKKAHETSEAKRRAEHDASKLTYKGSFYPATYQPKYAWFDGFYVIGAIGAGIFLIASAISFIPYNSTYYNYYSVSGNITSVSNQFISGTGDNSTTGYTLKLNTTGPRVLSTEDSRITQFHKGDKIELTCTVEWVYQGQDKTNCFVRSY